MGGEAAILVTILVYLGGMVAIGLAFRGSTLDDVDYYLGGRRLGPLVSSLSASASSSSAWTLLGVSGFAYTTGLSAIWLLPACVGGFVVNWFLLAPGLRRISHDTEALTSTEVLARCGGEQTWSLISAVGSAIILVSLTTYVASQFQGAGKTFAVAFDVSRSTSIVLGAGIVVVYTLLGGFWAVSVTDSIQGLVMAVTSLTLPIGAVMAVGPSTLVEKLQQVPIEGYLSPWRGLAPAAAIGMAGGLLGIGLGYPGQPHVVNRFMALREGAGALRTARVVAVSWAVVVYTGMIVLGLAARALLADFDDGERAFMLVADAVFPPVVAGVMIAAILSAVMSTADSQLLVAASAVTHDLRLGDRAARLLRPRIVVLALSGGAVAAALLVEESIFSRVLFAWSSMGCAFGPLLLVTVLRGPVSPAATLTSMALGFGLSVGAYVARQFGMFGDWAGVFERVVPFAIALAAALVGSGRRPA